MRSAIKILEYCAATDVQAQRMLYIIKSFLADVDKHSKSSVTSEQSELALPDAYIGDPEEVLQTRRQSLTSRRNHVPHQPPSTPIGGESSSDAMEYYPHVNADARRSTPHFQHMGTLVMRGERAAAANTVPRRMRIGRSHHRRTELALAKAARMETEPKFEEFDHDNATDFRPRLNSDDTKVYTRDYGSSMIPHGEQPAFQIHQSGGSFRAYPTPGTREPERAQFGRFLYIDKK